jgi:hypothetical protein
MLHMQPGENQAKEPGAQGKSKTKPLAFQLPELRRSHCGTALTAVQLHLWSRQQYQQYT